MVNTTNQGMVGHAALDLSLVELGPSVIVADIIYRPLQSPLLAAAQASGLRNINGLGMMLHQGIPAWKRWFQPYAKGQERACKTDDAGHFEGLITGWLA
ncbi:MAG: shikimate dehydrogenase [Paracoccaceae bacterium]